MKQTEALAVLESGESVLITGAAGAGKTYLLNEFIKRSKQSGKYVAVTATTGLAASHLGGTTLHAWSGIGIKDELEDGFFRTLSKSRADLIRKADVLIIDEISMLHDFRLDMIEQITRTVREVEEPFGGMQVVLCGDFYQLPPVNRSDSKQGGFVTNSQTWNDGSFTVCYIKEQYRQADDTAYSEILNGIRAGRMQRTQLDSLLARSKAVNDPWAQSTKLLTINVDVDSMNRKELDKIDGEEVMFEMTTTGTKRYVDQLKKSCLAQEELRLKKGAHVMFVKNSADKRYVNGSLGKVIGFEDATNYPIVELTANNKQITAVPETWELVDGTKKRASLMQIPLRLSWAITVHKSQGMTLDSAQIDLSRAFVEGMGYVALSRVKALDKLYLTGMNSMALRVSPEAMQIDERLRAASEKTLERHSENISKWHEQEKTRPKKVEASQPAGTWAEKLAKMRKDHPSAYTPWKESDDAVMLEMFGEGESVKKISDKLGRHTGSIRARLKKHLGDDALKGTKS